MASATLSKPLSRECLVNLFGKLLSKFPGSGLCVSREPHLPRIRLSKTYIKLPKNFVKEKRQGKDREGLLTGDHDLSRGSLKEIKPECKEETVKESKKVDYQSPEWVDRLDHDILEIQSAVQLASDMLFFKSHDVRPESVGLVLDSACKKLDSLKELVEGVWQSVRLGKMNSPEEKKVLEAQGVK